MTPKPTIKTRGLFSHFYQEKPLSRKPSSRMFGLLLGAFAVGMLMSPEAFAVKEGEMSPHEKEEAAFVKNIMTFNGEFLGKDAEKRKGVIHA